MRTHWDEAKKAQHPKGGQFPGEAHPRARLTDDDVISIRRFVLKQGNTMSEVSRWFNVSRQHVLDICRMRRWKHLIS